MKIFENWTIIGLISVWSFQASAQEKVTGKLNSIILPILHFEDTPLSDALAFIQQKSVELDPEKQGVNIVILQPELRNNLVTLELKNASLSDVLRYTTMLAGARTNTTKFAVTVTTLTAKVIEPEEMNTKAIEAKMRSIILPSVEFNDTPLTDALKFLVLRSGELDSSNGGGINIIYQGDRKTGEEAKVTLRLSNIPLYETLKYTTQIADHHYKIEPNAIVVSR